MRYESPLTFHPRFELDNRRVAGIAGGQLLDVVHHYLHRAASTHRQGVGQGNIHRGSLAPVVTANSDRIEADALLGEPQRNR
jgi:hypothetical protein